MIAIVTDSTACMTQKEANELGVVYVPMTYSINGISYTEDFVDVGGEIDLLFDEKNNNLRTSQANAHSFMRTFFKLREEGYEVLCLTISSKLSGTYNNALNCARELGEEAIKVLDTRTTAGGLLILAKAARRLIDQGFSLSETAKKIRDMCDRIKITFSVSDMAPLRRSGRLGPVRQSVGTILNMKPILICKDGYISAYKLVRGNRERLSELLNTVPMNAKEMIVHHSLAEDAANLLANDLRAKRSGEVIIRKVCPTLGIHLGLDVVGVAWLEAEAGCDA